jgi:hypothetical protein
MVLSNIEVHAEGLQRAALDATLWPEVMSDICRQSGSVGAVLFSGDVHFHGFPTTPSLSERIDSYVKDGWSLRDERRRGMPTLLAKGIISDEDCNSPDVINRSAFYQEFLRPNDFGSFIGVGFKAGQDVWLLSLNRSVGQAPSTRRSAQRSCDFGARSATPRHCRGKWALPAPLE